MSLFSPHINCFAKKIPFKYLFLFKSHFCLRAIKIRVISNTCISNTWCTFASYSSNHHNYYGSEYTGARVSNNQNFTTKYFLN